MVRPYFQSAPKLDQENNKLASHLKTHIASTPSLDMHTVTRSDTVANPPPPNGEWRTLQQVFVTFARILWHREALERLFKSWFFWKRVLCPGIHVLSEKSRNGVMASNSRSSTENHYDTCLVQILLPQTFLPWSFVQASIKLLFLIFSQNERIVKATSSDSVLVW